MNEPTDRSPADAATAAAGPEPAAIVPAPEPVPSPRRGRSPVRRLGLVAGLVLLAAASVTAVLWARGDLTAWQRARAARAAADAADPQVALDQARRWVAAEPENAEAHALEGRALYRLDDPDAAMRAFDQARKRGWPDAEMERYIGIILARGGDISTAEPMLIRAREREGQPRADLAEALAKMYLETYRLGPALDVLTYWAGIAPEDPRPHLWRAEVDARLDAGPGALTRDYREALKRDPTLDQARIGLAHALRAEAKYDEAAPEYEAYLQANPGSVDALTGAGLNALSLGREDRAIDYFDRALKADPEDVAALDGRAAIALRRRKFDEALPLLRRAVALNAFNADLRYKLANALERTGHPEEAATERARHAQLLNETKEMEELRRDLMRMPRDPELQSKAARWLLDHDQEKEGLIWAKRALEYPGGHPPTARILADYYTRKGNPAQANYYRLQAGNAAPPAK